jgi:hypothetical protein
MPVSSPHVTAKSVIIIIESKLDNYNLVFFCNTGVKKNAKTRKWKKKTSVEVSKERKKRKEKSKN